MDALPFGAAVFVAMFVVVDVIATVPIFLGLTAKYEPSRQRRVAWLSLLVALAVEVGFVMLGQRIFRLLSIEMYAFRVAGGLLLLIVGTEMLFGRKTRTEYDEESAPGEVQDVTFTPLAIPLHTGPAAITTGLVLWDRAQGVAHQIAFFSGLTAAYLVSVPILILSPAVLRLIGQSGAKVVVRIMGLLLSALGVQFIANGAREWIATLGA